MSRLVVKRSIHAPIDLVFKTVAHVDHFSKAVSSVVNRLVNLMISGMVRKAVEADMDSVKAFCER